jgi:MFS family permease
MTELQTPVGYDPARALVPTDREFQLGQTGDAGPIAFHTEAAGPSLRQQLRATWARDFGGRKIEGPKLPLFVIATGSFIGGWDTQAASVLGPTIRDSFHVSTQFLINLSTIFVIIVLGVGPFIGYAVDRVKRLWLFIPGVALAALGRLGAAVPGGIGLLGGARAVTGLSASLSNPPTYPLMADYYAPSVRARTFTISFGALTLGTVVGPELTSGMTALFGFRSVFAVLGLLSLIVAVAACRLREPTRGALDRLEAGLDPLEEEPPPPSWAESWRAAAAINTMRRIWLCVMFLTFGGAELTTIILPLYYKDRFHVGTADRGYILTLFAFAGLLGIVFSGPLADRLLADRPARLMTLWAGVIFAQAGIFVVIAFTPSLLLTILLTLPVGFTSALLTPGLTILVSLVIPARMRGIGVSTISWFSLLGVVMFVVVYNGLFAHESLNLYFAIFAPFVALGGFVLLGIGPGLDRDIRSAMASGAAEAEVRKARESGREKMIDVALRDRRHHAACNRRCLPRWQRRHAHAGGREGSKRRRHDARRQGCLPDDERGRQPQGSSVVAGGQHRRSSSPNR